MLQGCNTNQGLVAMETRPVTGDLLALDNEMNIYSLKLYKSKRNTDCSIRITVFMPCVLGHVERKYCFQLSDPIGRFQTSPLLHNQPITERLQLFSYHDNIGVLYKGCLRLVICTRTHVIYIHNA